MAGEGDASVLATVFGEGKAARDTLLYDPKKAVADAGGPDALGIFLASLSRGERHILIDTWEHMGEGGFTADVGGTTVSFL